MTTLAKKTFATPAAKTSSETLYRFRLGASWKGAEASCDIIAVSKSDASLFVRENIRVLVGMPKSSIDTLGWVETIEADRQPTPLSEVAQFFVDKAHYQQ